MGEANLHEVERRFVSLECATSTMMGMSMGMCPHPCQGMYYFPTGKRPRTAFIASDYSSDFSEHFMAEYFARRGFGFLGWNTRFHGNEQHFLLEHALVDIDTGVRWLWEQADVEQVILLGSSTGGSLMAAYQAQSVDFNLSPLPDCEIPMETREMLGGDYYVSLCAHAGRPEVLTHWLDPSVVDESDPTKINERINMYNPGFGPPYNDVFIRHYREAQRERNDSITEWAKSELIRMRGLLMYDRTFLVYRTWADLRLMDGDRAAGVCYVGNPRNANWGPRGMGMINTLRSWLNMWSMKHSPCRGVLNLERVGIPALVIQTLSDCGVFPEDAKTLFNDLGSDDKTLEFTRGDHCLTEPEDARDVHADIICEWLKERGVLPV